MPAAEFSASHLCSGGASEPARALSSTLHYERVIAARDTWTMCLQFTPVIEGDRLIADGGRVLAVTATAKDIAQAQKRAYEAVDRIDWPGGFCRRDIGWRALRH